MLKKFLLFLSVFLVGLLVGLSITFYSWVKPINGKMARINETHLISGVAALDLLQAGKYEELNAKLNHNLDRELTTVYVWTQEKVPASDDVKAAIRHLERLRAESGLYTGPEAAIAEPVKAAFKLANPPAVPNQP